MFEKYFFSPANSCMKANEVYSPFANNACERSCNKLEVDGCINTCESSRCVCSPGYVRSVDGSCILPSQCRKYFFFIKLQKVYYIQYFTPYSIYNTFIILFDQWYNILEN